MNTPIPTLTELLEQEPQLLTLPAIVSELLSLIDDPQARLEHIVKVAEQDAGLTARVLRLINSPYYALPLKVDSMQHAVSLMGLQNLRDLVIATKVAERFQHVSGELMDMHTFWRNSLYSASVARDIYRALGHNRYNLFAVSMLHHLGTMVLLQSLPQTMTAILESVRGSYRELFEAEQTALGYTHADVGAALLAGWELPEVFIEVTRHHHDFYHCERYGLEAAVVHLADTIAQRDCPLLHFEGLAVEPDLAVYRYVTLAQPRLERLASAVSERGGGAVNLFD
jgi:HD-like signal output (HDOD) protein